MFVELGEPHGLRTIALNLGICAMERGDYTTARASLDEALARSREIGVNEQVGAVLLYLGLLDLLERRHQASIAAFSDALENCIAYGFRPGVALALRGLAASVAHRGELVRAARMLGAAEAIDEQTGAPGWSYERAALAESARPIGFRADEPEIAQALAAGRAMNDSEAAACALATAAEQPATIT